MSAAAQRLRLTLICASALILLLVGAPAANAAYLQNEADLSISKTVSDFTPNVGDQVVFTVTLTNSGAGAATDVTVTDLLPSGLTFVSATPSQGAYNPATGEWSVGTLAAASLVTLQIRARVDTPTPTTNFAVITFQLGDPFVSPNTGSATVSPTSADLALTKVVNNPTPNVGDQVVFTVTLNNQGPDTATNVTVTDLLPAGLTFVSAS